MIYASFNLATFTSFQEVHDDNNRAEEPVQFIHGRLPEVTRCVCARAESLVEAVRGLECRLNQALPGDVAMCDQVLPGGVDDEDALAAAAGRLQNDLRYVEMHTFITGRVVTWKEVL